MKDVVGGSFNYSINNNALTNSWITYTRVEPQGEVAYKGIFDPIRMRELSVRLTTGENIDVEMPIWWGEIDKSR
jgi:hypothetical protein